MEKEICLIVPAEREYALVFRMALSGIAHLKDLSVGELDDLRMASDEAFDCLLHQGTEPQKLQLCVCQTEKGIVVSIAALEMGSSGCQCEDAVAMTRAVLETLIPELELGTSACGCVTRIDMTLPRAYL